MEPSKSPPRDQLSLEIFGALGTGKEGKSPSELQGILGLRCRMVTFVYLMFDFFLSNF
jgi:hypothetical protein